MLYLWHTFLYDPLLNALIALYNNFAGQNLGVALVELTVLIRIFLLPLTVISIRARNRYDRLRYKLHAVHVSHRNDSVRRKEAVRALLHAHHINPWAKASVLGIQFLAIIVLYQVFITAVRANDFTGLYDWNEAPDFLNHNFLGFDLAARSFVLPLIIAVLLYLDLWFDQRKHHETITNTDVMYRAAFPIATFLVLYALPTGKSVFVLTSILFSITIEGVRRIFVRPAPILVDPQEEGDDGGELIE